MRVARQQKRLGVLGEMWKTITKDPALLAVLLSAFIVIKVIYVAQGDIQTALGVFSNAGVAAVIAGSLLSAFPLISAAVLGLASFELATCRRIRIFPFTEQRAAVLWVIWGSAAVSCILLTPWTIAAASLLLGLFFGLVTKMKKRRAKKIFLFLLSLASIYLVVNPLLYAVWLPHEVLAVNELNGRKVVPQPVSGYVLSDSNGWVSVLRTGERRIYRFHSNEVISRTLCRGRLVPAPLLPDLFKDADSPWQTFVDTRLLNKLGLNVSIPTNKLQKCS
jgi:hypothetical protein